MCKEILISACYARHKQAKTANQIMEIARSSDLVLTGTQSILSLFHLDSIYSSFMTPCKFKTCKL